MMKPFNYLANAVRAPEIVAILGRWGFEDLLLQLDTPQFLLRNLVRKKVTHLTPYERVRNACEELGPIFVKFGQILSTRPDRLPEPLVMELKKLRSQVEPQPYEKIEPVLLKDIGCPLDELFAEFDPSPVAAGSLGQVYRAQLRSNGEWVAVKVQRADIRKTISSDFEIIGWFARQLHARVEDLRAYNLPMLVKEAERRLEEELDYFLGKFRDIGGIDYFEEELDGVLVVVIGLRVELDQELLPLERHLPDLEKMRFRLRVRGWRIVF